MGAEIIKTTNGSSSSLSILESFKKHTNLKLLYFFEFASLSCFQPFISIYLKEQGLKPSLIGIITCLIPFLSFLSSPFWTNITDRFGIQKQIVLINSVVSMFILLLLIPTGNNVVGLFILIGLYSIVQSPVCPIIDTLVLKDLGEDSKLYGQQRLTGAVSYGIVAFFTGIIIQHLNINMLYVIYAFWTVIFLVFYIFNQTQYTSKLSKVGSLNSFKKLINEKDIELNQCKLDISNDKITTPTIATTTPRSNIISSNEIIQSNENCIENEREDLLDQEMDLDEIGSLVFSSNNNSSQDLGEHSNQNSSIETNGGGGGGGNAILTSNIINTSFNSENNILLKDGADYISASMEEESIAIDLIVNEEKLTNKQVFVNLIKNTQMVIFLFAILVCGMTGSIIGNFVFLFLKDHKSASNFLLGSVVPFTVVMELPFFFFGKQLLDKLGVNKMIIIGHSAYILRLICYNIFVFDISPWFVLPIEALHGISFASIFTAGIHLCNEIAPKGYETTYQGIFSGIYCGLGSGIGSIIGGFFYEHLGAFFLFRFTAIATLISLAAFSLSQIYFSRKNKSNVINNDNYDMNVVGQATA